MMTDEASPREQSHILQWMSRPVDADLLVYFRIVFGFVALSWVLKQFTSGAIDHFYSGPKLHFHYHGFHWIQILPEPWTRIEFGILGVAAILIVCGAFYRVGALAFAVGFTHLFLGDKTLYQNHYYLICLVSWLMVVLPANCRLSFDAHWWPSIASSTVPSWAIWLLRFQLGVPYFFGGIAKINPDWLDGEPMRFMLSRQLNFPMVGQFFDQEWCVLLFAYGGLLFDLLVIPALVSKRFRTAACIIAVCFHTTNAWLFTIGVFPWFMLFSLPVFFEPSSIARFWSRETTAPSTRQHFTSFSTNAIGCLLAVYVGWQLLFPMRHFLMPGNPSWTEEGHYFAWHMLLRGKRSALRYEAFDPKTNRAGAIDLRPYVTTFQLNRVARDPRMIHELAQNIGEDLRDRGFDDVRLHAISLVSMNGRKPQMLVDPDVDLLRAEAGWQQPKWIVPLHEPLRREYWSLPMSEWESASSKKPAPTEDGQ